MKKLGLIGGVEPEATIPHYHGIIYGVQKKLNRPYFPSMVIESLSCFEVIRMSSQNDRDGLTEYLLSGIRNLVAARAEIGALACDTGHMVFDELKKQLPIQLVSIAETPREEALPKVATPHALCHTFCTNLANARMNPKSLQYIMGHSNINVTLNYYVHVTADNAMAEMERLIA